MIPVKGLIEVIKSLPEDAWVYGYEGEIVGIVFVTPDGKELGYIPTTDSGFDDIQFVKNETHPLYSEEQGR